MSDNTNASTAPLGAAAVAVPSDSTKLAQNGAGYQRNPNIGGTRDTPLINVEPPRREDLQIGRAHV